MGSRNSASSGNAMASGQSGAKKTSIALQANQYAKDKLGITGPNVMNTPAGTLVTKGYTSSTVKNQMYGSEYNKARNEYLASAGYGTMQKNGSFTTGVQTDKGLTFTSEARDIYNQTRNQPIPLSKQMYESQQRFTQGVAAVAALAGIPLMPGVLYYKSKQPYLNYLSNNKQVFSYSSGSNQTSKDSNQTSDQTTEMGNQDPNEFRAENEAARKKYLASLKGGELAKGDRKFISTSPRGFGNTFLV